jgi:hypothetical protein
MFDHLVVLNVERCAQRFHYRSPDGEQKSIGLRADMSQWLLENCGPDAHRFTILNENITFSFKEKSKALLFKLTWHNVPSILQEPAVPRPGGDLPY